MILRKGLKGKQAATAEQYAQYLRDSNCINHSNTP